MSMRVCIEILTGKLIEGQSGAAPLGTLIANAVEAGYAEAEVEEKVVSQAEYQVLLDAALPPPPTDADIYDQIVEGQKVVKALVLCINDGSIVPGANATPAALKAAIVAKM
jgi:hypothetical protein